MANKILGIHLGPNVVKLVELEEQAAAYKLLNWSLDYFSADKADKIEENQAKLLAAALQRKNIKSRQARVTISGPDIIYKLVELPALPEKEVEAALKFKIAGAISFPLKEAVYDYYKISGPPAAGGKLFYFAAIAPKERVLNVIKLLKKSGITVREILPLSAALNNASAVRETAAYAIVSFSQYSTAVALVKQGEVVFAREVMVGGENVTQAMVGVVQAETGRIELDRAKAEELKNKFGIPVDFAAFTGEARLPAAEVLEMMRPALEKIGEEILRTLAFYRETTGDQTEFSRAYFTGGVSRTKNWDTYFSTALGLAIEPLPLVVAADPALSQAVGAAALKKTRLSLLPAAARGGWVKNPLNYWTVLAVYLLILAAIFGFYQLKYLAAAAQLKNLRQSQALPPPADQAPPGSTDRFVRVIGHIHRIIPKDIYFSKLTYDRSAGQLAISGVIDRGQGENLLSLFIGNLAATRDFAAIDIAFLKESNRFTVPTYDFEIICRLAGDK